ncbi:hypothetical protein VF21_10010 [Pseudogymnoascus sp. 05NY08]|nr:hypothetical protein VF21_10010 [Pseudogymnoascus sp. 05NY08]
MATLRNQNRTPLLIIGGGASGICTAIDMIRRNKSRDFIIVEKGSQIGGTWNDNRYPGCCCDIWSHLYSYSFDPNPAWTREYPTQEEILAYLIRVATSWGLYKHIRFNTVVEEATWNESLKQWSTVVRTTSEKEAEYSPSYTITSDFLVSAVGQLNVPAYPNINGLDLFQGKAMHSARWDRSFDLKDKRIAVIGNGATAAQIIPEIAETAKNVTVYQRTPNWVIPRDDKPISKTMQWMYQYIPTVRKRYRAGLMDYRESFYDAAVDEHSAMNSIFKKLSLDMLDRQIPGNATLRKQLTPNYPPGCKRVIISDDYFPAINRANVRLETRSIDEVCPTGIKAGGEAEEFDLIVLATGFRTVDFMYPIKITGLNGRSIEDIWKDGAMAYLGIAVEGLPNFGMLYGPNTNLGHNSIILMIEAQSRYINTLISATMKARASGGTLSIAPASQRIKSYNVEIQKRLQNSTFANSSCKSWYKTADGLVTNNWCGTVVEYQERTSVVDWDDFVLSGSGTMQLQSQGPAHIGRIIEETQQTSSLTSMGWVLTVGAIVVGAIYTKIGPLSFL